MGFILLILEIIGSYFDDQWHMALVPVGCVQESTLLNRQHIIWVQIEAQGAKGLDLVP